MLSIPSKIPVQKIKTQRSILKNVYVSWKWEFANCLLLLATPFIIFATLYPHDGQPLPQWPFQISANTLLSVYSMVLRASLSFIVVSCIGQLQWNWFSRSRPLYDLVRYDNAGRGAWGSLALLWAQHFHQPLAALCSILVILSIGIDPSIQQLISSSDCSIAVTDRNATLPRTNMFFVARDYEDLGAEIASKFQSALVRGVTQPGSGLYAECQTGNCSFPDQYGTIGYCSYCEDASRHVRIGQLYTTMSNGSLGPGIKCSDNSSVVLTVESTVLMDLEPGLRFLSPPNVTIKNYFADSPSCDIPSRIEVVKVGTQRLSVGVNVWILTGNALFSDDHSDIFTGKPILGCDTSTSTNLWRCRGYGAANCTIYPCVQTYNATVEAGRLTERLVSQSEVRDWGYGSMEGEKSWEHYNALGMVDTRCLMPEMLEGLVDRGYTVNKTSRWLPYEFKRGIDADWSLENSLLANKCLYAMDSIFVAEIASLIIDGSLTGTVNIAKRGLLNNFAINIPDGPQTLQHMYDSGRVDIERIRQTFENISDSLTTYVRTNGFENYSDPAVGQVLHYATCIRVRWEWMPFFSSVVVLTIVLFIVTVCSEPLERFPVWKASLLPWLLCGPGGAEILKEDPLEETSYNADDMEKKAREVNVTWKPLPNPHIQL
ncbi:hypothetical protein F5Y04DRAFT_271275 [Hypomontagnella monticulosa]|nr:hypothetical protein F5Y04DRAFT_271275 [Hypomontagnella monticulosa]